MRLTKVNVCPLFYFSFYFFCPFFYILIIQKSFALIFVSFDTHLSFPCVFSFMKVAIPFSIVVWVWSEKILCVKFGVTRGFLERTPPFRSLVLYPIELRALLSFAYFFYLAELLNKFEYHISTTNLNLLLNKHQALCWLQQFSQLFLFL